MQRAKRLAEIMNANSLQQVPKFSLFQKDNEDCVIRIILRAALLEEGELDDLEAALQQTIDNKDELIEESEPNE